MPSTSPQAAARALQIRRAIAVGIGDLMQPVLLVVTGPIYIRYLGFEAYGLIGFLSSALLTLNVVTQGFGLALQRELGSRIATGRQQSIPSLVRTIEIVYGTAGVALMAVWLVVLLIVSTRLDARDLTDDVLLGSGLLLGFRVMLSVVRSVYQGVLFAGDQQATSAAIATAMALANTAVGLTVVVATRSVLWLYACDAAIAAAALAVARAHAVRTVRRLGVQRPAFDLRELRRMIASAAQLAWSHGAGTILKQADRFLLGMYAPLAQVGLYTIATAPGRALTQVPAAYLTTVFPQTCRLAASGDPALIAHVWENARITLVIAVACAAPLAGFAEPVLRLLTGVPEAALQGVTPLRSYVYAAACSAMASAFTQAAVAMDRAKFNAVFHTAALFWFLPTLWIAVQSGGGSGAAHAWLLFCLVSLIVHAGYFAAISHAWALLGRFALTTVTVVGAAAAVVHAALLVLGGVGSVAVRLLAMIAISAIILFSLGALVLGGTRVAMRQLATFLRRDPADSQTEP